MIQGREGLALGILTIATFLGSLAIVQIASQPSRHDYRDPYAEGTGTDQELAENRTGIKNKRPAPDRSICSQAKTEKEYELCQAWRAASAAQEAADAAWTQIYISWVGLAGLLATVILTGIAAVAAAKAARETARSVDAQIRIEGPFLHLQEIKTFHQTPKVIHPVIMNSGNTPAVLIGYVVECVLGTDKLAAEPTYGTPIELDEEILEKGKTHTLFVSLRGEGLRHYFRDGGTIAVWGFVSYEDVFGRLRRRGFGSTTSIAYGDEGDDNLTPIWRRAGGKAYNYDREEEPQE